MIGRAGLLGWELAMPGGGDGAMATLVFPTSAQIGLSKRATADGRVQVTIRGELDIATAKEVHRFLIDAIDHTSQPVRVDLSGLAFCDAAGLGVFAKAAGYARAAGKRFEFAAARPGLLRIMRITGLDVAFPELRSPALTMITGPEIPRPVGPHATS